MNRTSIAGVADALAEFVDNSLQAMHYNVHPPGADEQGPTAIRLIEIKVFFDERSIVIADNGEGMDQQKLTEYATFALEQDMRGTTGKEFISKFGVGAKQAGFYIGDRIAIKTRKRNQPILEFVIDEARLEQRAQEKGAVFRDSIVIREEPDPESEGLSPMEKYIARHQREHSHFTVIILRMRPHVESSMRRNPDIAESLSKDLADIYHFHLHPNDLPNSLVRSERFHDLYHSATASRGGKKKRSSLGTVKETTAMPSNFIHVATQNANSNLSITLEVIASGKLAPGLPVPSTVASATPGVISRPLGRVSSAPSRLIHAPGAYPFRFNLYLPDPRPEELAPEACKELSRLTKDAADGV